jgi:hypothetical protein
MPGGTCTFSYLARQRSRDEALLRSAYHATSIEGNRLSLEEVADLIDGREVTSVLAENGIRPGISWSAQRTPLGALSRRWVSDGVQAGNARPFGGQPGRMQNRCLLSTFSEDHISPGLEQCHLIYSKSSPERLSKHEASGSVVGASRNCKPIPNAQRLLSITPCPKLGNL